MTGWRRVRLKHLAAVPIVNGLGEPGEHDNPQWPRYVRTTDIAGPRRLREDTFKSLPITLARRAPLEHGDVVMVAAGATIGKSYLHASDQAACFAGYLVRFRPRPDVDSRFVAYWTESAPYWQQIESHHIKATIENFSAARYRNLIVDVPAHSEQQRIADFLDRETTHIDTIVCELGRLRDLAQERMQLVVDQAILSCPRRIPLKREVEFKEGPGIMAEDFRESGVPLIRIAGLTGGRVTLEGCNFLSPEQVTRRWNHFGLASGDYLLSASASMGLISRVDEEAAGGIPYTGLIRLRPRSSEVEMRYVKYFFLSRGFFDQVDALRRGVGIEHYGPTHLSRMWMPLPPISQQRAIADQLASVNARTSLLGQNIRRLVRLLEERRRTLITAAVTGQLDHPRVG